MVETKRKKNSSKDFKIKKHSLEVLSCGSMNFNIISMMIRGGKIKPNSPKPTQPVEVWGG